MGGRQVDDSGRSAVADVLERDQRKSWEFVEFVGLLRSELSWWCGRREVLARCAGRGVLFQFASG